MHRSRVFRGTVIPLIAALAIGGCTRLATPSGPQPVTNASAVEFAPFGPAQPTSGFDTSGSVVIQGNSGVFGTSDPIAVTDSGPFDAGSRSFDTALADLSLDDQALLSGSGIDFGTEAALAAALTFPGETGGESFFDAGIGETVYFDTDSSALTDAARETLRSQAAWLSINPDVTATIEGHADERGTREYNLALGERRASATRGYLLNLGIEPSRLLKVSYGKERPAASGSDAAAWSQNRRTVTTLSNGASAGFSTLSSFDRAPGPSSIQDLLNDPLLNDLPAGDPLLSDPLLNDPLLNDPLLNDPLLEGL